MATINGSNGNNNITGTAAADDIFANGGNDSVRAGDGADTIYGGVGNDTLLGETGDDRIFGDAGTDRLFGGDGNDSLYGGADADSLEGGAGNDLLNGGAGNDTLVGGAGVDTVDYSDATSGVTVNLTNGTATGASIGSDVLSQLENIFGSAFNDNLTGSIGDNLIDAGAGNDTITALAGSDTVYGGAGNDSIDAGTSSQPANTSLDFNWSLVAPDETSVAGGVVQDTGGIQVSVGFVNDGAATEFSIESNTSIYTAPGETFNPTSSLYIGGTGGTQNSTTTIDFSSVAGSGFEDEVQNVTFRLEDIDRANGSWEDRVTIRAYDANGNEIPVTITPAGADTVSGNTVIAAEGANAPTDAEGSVLITIPGPVARIVIDYDNGFTNGQLIQISDVHFEAVAAEADLVDGGDGDDTISTGIGNDTIFGGTGADSIDAGSGNDSIDAGDGNDVVTAGAGDDTIIFGNGNDTVYGGDGNDLIDDQAGMQMTGVSLIYGGAGNDTIYTGFSNDIVYGGDGLDLIFGEGDNDSLFGGAESDALYGGDGADTLSGDAGNDTLQGDAGADVLYGGLGTDLLGGGADNDSLFGGDGADTLYGDAGSDTLSGDLGADLLYGGLDADVLFGGADSDTLYGGAGTDFLDGGDGPDLIDGGADQDTIIGGIGDTISGGNSGTDLDVLDLTAWGKALTNITFDPNNPENGTVEFLDANGAVIGTMSFTDIETVIPCFTPGTMILTDFGAQAVEELQVGDLVLTRDNGLQPIRWIGKRNLSLAELVIRPSLRPVRIAKGALGDAMPSRDMLVSPQHRVLVEGADPEMLFGEREVLVAAVHLLGRPGIEQTLPQGITYIHIMFDQHEVVHSDGCWTESFQPGQAVMQGMKSSQRDEVLELFPELADDPKSYPAARPTLLRHEARVLFNL